MITVFSGLACSRQNTLLEADGGGKRSNPFQAACLLCGSPVFSSFHMTPGKFQSLALGSCGSLSHVSSVLLLHFPCALWQPESNLQSEGWGLGVRDKGQVSKAQLPFLSSACLECIYFFTLERNLAPPLVLYSPLP